MDLSINEDYALQRMSKKCESYQEGCATADIALHVLRNACADVLIGQDILENRTGMVQTSPTLLLLVVDCAILLGRQHILGGVLPHVSHMTLTAANLSFQRRDALELSMTAGKIALPFSAFHRLPVASRRNLQTPPNIRSPTDVNHLFTTPFLEIQVSSMFPDGNDVIYSYASLDLPHYEDDNLHCLTCIDEDNDWFNLFSDLNVLVFDQRISSYTTAWIRLSVVSLSRLLAGVRTCNFVRRLQP
ncbi:hypothetical protein T12_15465 [Trichinella patagoniensis]|uniref:Uncharacterized protein n=1 Tax=Trichinella patagoniensis TaxID=990121 RepID=A0A0V1ACC7_9BILA|nr:hypothetical protein T12_15465 [Trichinella patagoniensis]